MAHEYKPEEVSEGLTAILDGIEEYVRVFVRLPESSVPAVVAWIAHTYLTDENGFPACVTPRLGFTSRKRGGGKSQAIGVVQRLSKNGETIILPSKAGWMNAIERDHSTICLEEADKTFPKENSRIEIQAAMNSGYAPDGGTILHGNRKVPTHAFAAFAGIGPVLECNAGLEPLWSRTIKVEMIQAYGMEYPEYDRELHGKGTKYLREAIASWMDIASLTYGSGLRKLMPEPLADVEPRRNQIWRVLRRIGIAAGGDWQARIDESCEDMESGRSSAEPVKTQQQRIWPDVRAVTMGESQVGTMELVRRLRALPDSPWSFLWSGANTGSARELAALLEPHGLVVSEVRTVLPGNVGTLKEKGYRLTDHRQCTICPKDGLSTDELGSDADDPSAARMEENGTDGSAARMDVGMLAALMSVQPTTARRPVAPVFRQA